MWSCASLFPLISLSVAQQYNLQSSFAGSAFLDGFQFWTSGDPTLGYVHYINQEVAEQYAMLNITNSSTAWGVDTTQVLDPNANLGRLSIRLTSIETWTHGLFVLDLEHMPVNQCGVWPAFWTLGSGTWPANGEIDIIEFTNNLPNNLMALHTSSNCSMAGSGQTGTLLTDDCDTSESSTGCSVSATSPDNEGNGFDDFTNGGGVYVMQWTSTAIQIWYFQRNEVQQHVLGVNVTEIAAADISSFGTPMANFRGSCDLDAHFFNHTLVFDTDFCGSYAGDTWQPDGCPLLDPSNGWQSCNDFVANNPQAYTNAYWEVNYLNVYQTISGTDSTPSSSLSSVEPAISTSSVATIVSNAQGRSTTPTGTPSLVTTFGSTPSSPSMNFEALPSIPIATTPGSLAVSLAISGTNVARLSTSPSGMLMSSSLVTTNASTSSSSTLVRSSSSTGTCTNCVDDVLVWVTVTVDPEQIAPPMEKHRRHFQGIYDDVSTTYGPEPFSTTLTQTKTAANFASTSDAKRGKAAVARISITSPYHSCMRLGASASTSDSGCDPSSGDQLASSDCSCGSDCVVKAKTIAQASNSFQDAEEISGIRGYCGGFGFPYEALPAPSPLPGQVSRRAKTNADGLVTVRTGAPLDKRDTTLLPGGVIGFCGPAGMSCNEHHERQGDAEGNNNVLGDSTTRRVPVRDSRSDRTASAIIVDTVVVVVNKTQTVPHDEPVFSPAGFSCSATPPDWAAIPTLGPRNITTIESEIVVIIVEETVLLSLPPVVTYTPTSFPIEPTALDKHVAVPAGTASPPRDTSSMTLNATAGLVNPPIEVESAYGTYHPLAHATCTPVVIAPDGVPKPIGCLGPQGLIKGENVEVASTTMTVDAARFTPIAEANGRALHVVGTDDESLPSEESKAASVPMIPLSMAVLVSSIAALLTITYDLL